MTYLITGATGDIGSRITTQLLERGIRPRILARNPERAQALFGNRVDIFAGDLADPPTTRHAMHGANVLFLLNSGPEIPQRDAAAAAIAKQVGIARIVKLSSLDVELGLAIGAWHEKGEAAIRASGVPFTFVRPTGFMSNLLAWAHAIRTEGIVRSSTGNGRRPFIHSDDIAAVCVAALVTGHYISQALSITGPASLTFAEATGIISHAICKPLAFEAISDNEARSRYHRISGSPEETEAHVALWRAIREGRLAVTTNCVERILARKPIPLEQWAAENVRSFLDGPGPNPGPQLTAP